MMRYATDITITVMIQLIGYASINVVKLLWEAKYVKIYTILTPQIHTSAISAGVRDSPYPLIAPEIISMVPLITSNDKIQNNL